MDPKLVADKLADVLKRNGISVLRYDSYGSSSIYLKFDYGVANSLRIADHKGKKHLAYRYNLRLDIDEYYEDTSGKYPRYYYPLTEVKQLALDIINNARQKREKYGAKYATLMQRNKDNGDTHGFWKQAKEV